MQCRKVRFLNARDIALTLRAVGKWADFIVLDKPLHEMAPEEIANVQVRKTVWKGQIVFAS